jgi:hypothetical protein
MIDNKQEGRFLVDFQVAQLRVQSRGRHWRVIDSTSLFDYQPGQSTATFTDRSLPRDLMTLGGLSPDDSAAAATAEPGSVGWLDACKTHLLN